MTTKRDPWVNMLRTTVACFAAGVGGADVVTVQPFDAALGLPDAFSRRIARNTQSLLVEEGSLARVLDPAGGSWYVESLTDDLAQAAWAWFTEIERAGGLAAALDSGLVGDRIAAAWEERSTRLATRTDAITGVSEFPNLAEKLPEREPGRRRCGRPAGCRGCGPRRPSRSCATPRTPRPSRPQVYLATIGPVARHTARAGVRRQPVPGRRARDAVRGRRRRASPTPGRRSPASAAPTRTTPRRPPALAAELRDGRRDAVWLAGKPRPGGRRCRRVRCTPGATPSTSCAPCTSSWE